MLIRPLRHGELDALLELYTHLFARDEPLPERTRAAHHVYELCGFKEGVNTGFVAHP